MLTQNRSNRTPAGAKYKKARDKRLYETGSVPTHTRIGEMQVKRVRIKGGGLKISAVKADVANVLDPRSRAYKKSKIKTVADNPASKHFIRRNIITKGTIIETELGKARVTNRPGQEGTVNAVLV
ncbi:30S ribosomal protein S8e [Candidatus Woesearchaeota archaeon]|nr:30S ribosomal protein S8e [Candidatus Woesearchaeota archaeon]